MAVLALPIWAIWKRRNEFIHKEIQPNPIITIARANSLHDYLNLIEQISCTRGNGARNFHTSKAWRAPREDAIKINCDAAYKPHLRYAAIAAIARNSARTILSVSSKLIPAASALIAEALAVREGVSLASGSYSCRTLIESDNLTVIEAIRGGNQQCSIV
ncbi:Ribonuclease H-like superfamily [Sesbania bispinosa]|nr:Ribonuclease H-like superfamily [Sesbania bispinosa]